MTMDAHPTELLAALALDAVGDDERAAVEAHVATCPRCRQELDSMRGVAGALGNIVAPPPDHLWTRITTNLTGNDDAPPLAPELFGAPTARHSHAGRQRRAVRAMAAVCAVAAVTIGLLVVSLVQANDRADGFRAALRDPGRAAIAAALTTPGHRVVTLRSDRGAALAELVLLPSGKGYLVNMHLKRSPRQSTYELWAVVAGTPIPVGLMGRAPHDVAFATSSVPRPSAFAVTVEPSSGSLHPTTTPVGAASL